MTTEKLVAGPLRGALELLDKLPRYIFAPDKDSPCKQVPNGGWWVREDVLAALSKVRASSEGGGLAANPGAPAPESTGGPQKVREALREHVCRCNQPYHGAQPVGVFKCERCGKCCDTKLREALDALASLPSSPPRDVSQALDDLRSYVENEQAAYIHGTRMEQFCEQVLTDIRAIAALASPVQGVQAQDEITRLGVHLSHCNFGEQPNACKYGEDDCPALTEAWAWFGKALQRAAGQRAERAEASVVRMEDGGAMGSHYIAPVAEKTEPRRPHHIPYDIANQCLDELAFLDTAGEPNTLLALVKKASNLLHEKTELDQAGRGEPTTAQEYYERYFAPARKYIQENGYADWDGTANGQTITLTGCANMMGNFLVWLALGSGQELREALRKVNHLQHSMAIELDAIPQQPRIEYWTRQMEEVIFAALALPLALKVPHIDPQGGQHEN